MWKPGSRMAVSLLTVMAVIAGALASLVTVPSLPVADALDVELFDVDWGDGGVVEPAVSSIDFLVPTSSGGVFAVAGASRPAPASNGVEVLKYLSDGSLDSSFGDDGLAYVFSTSSAFRWLVDGATATSDGGLLLVLRRGGHHAVRGASGQS